MNKLAVLTVFALGFMAQLIGTSQSAFAKPPRQTESVMLYGGPLFANSFQCGFVNISDHDLTVTIRLFESLFGAPTQEIGNPRVVVVPPMGMEGNAVVKGSDANDVNYMYCQIEYNGSVGDLVGNYCGSYTNGVTPIIPLGCAPLM